LSQSDNFRLVHYLCIGSVSTDKFCPPASPHAVFLFPSPYPLPLLSVCHVRLRDRLPSTPPTVLDYKRSLGGVIQPGPTSDFFPLSPPPSAPTTLLPFRSSLHVPAERSPPPAPDFCLSITGFPFLPPTPSLFIGGPGPGPSSLPPSGCAGVTRAQFHQSSFHCLPLCRI